MVSVLVPAVFAQTLTLGANVVIPDSSLASAVGTVFSGTVDIQGLFIVDDDVLFQSAEVYMEPGAEILVQPGRNLDIINSSVQSCQGVMWKSIAADSASMVRIWNSLVDDAENVVSALDGSTLWLSGNQFHNNRTTVHVPTEDSLAYNNVSLYVQGNTFYSQGQMPQPYPGQASAVGTVGFAAADVHNTTLDFTGGGNIIHDMSNGIVAHQSDVSVSGCRMLDIQPDATYAYTGNGAGIYAKGDQGFYSVQQEGYGADSTASFVDCRWGLYTEYMSVKSTDNHMKGMGTAHRVDRSGYRRVVILRNSVFTAYHGMDLRFNDGAVQVLVENNEITFGDDEACVACRGYSAIHVTEGNYAAPNSKIMHNTIHFLALPASRFGISLGAADGWLVAENTLHMVDNGHNETGIRLSGCNRPEVGCNTVNGGPNGYPSNAQAAIRNLMGSDVHISCNEMDRTANGILFNYVTPNTNVRGNHFHNHKWPLHLDGTAIIGGQGHKGNLWDPNAAAPAWGAWYEDSLNAPNYPFLVDPATIGGGNTMPPSVWPTSGWFGQAAGTNYDCADDEGEDYCAQFHERGKERLSDLDKRVANDSLTNDPYSAESIWMLTSRLYKKLDDNPELQDSLQAMADLYDELQVTATADLKQIDDEQMHLYDLDSAVVMQLQAHRAETDSLAALMQDGLEQLGDSSLTSTQQQTALDGIREYHESIRDLTTWSAIALQTATGVKVMTADGVKSANAGIAPSVLIEANQKTVNDVYLATIGRDVDSFTSNQATELFAIANQCPMLGGSAVFKARSLYWLIDDTYDFDDAALCLPYGIIVKRLSHERTNDASVVPNPAMNEAALVLGKPLYEPGVFILYDAVGAEVFRHIVPVDMPRVTFNTTSLAPALYHYQVRGPLGIIGDGKLTIVR